MPFNIENFKAELNKNGIARTSNYEVQITPPAGLTVNGRSMESLTMRCEQVSLAGRNLTTAENKIYGPARKIGVDSSFNDVTFAFILSEDYNEKAFFEKWQDMIVGDYRKQNSATKDMYDLKLYDSYIGTINYRLYNEKGIVKYKTRLEEVYPLTVSDIDHSWATNEPARLNIVFAYHRIYEEDMSPQ